MSNIEILVGFLVVICILLFICQRNKSSDGMKNKYIPGLKEGYSNLPRAHIGESNGLSYTTRSNKFSENMENGEHGLNGIETTPTPASNNVDKPTGNLTNMRWAPDAEIPLDIYARDPGVNNTQMSSADEDRLLDNVFDRNSSQIRTQGSGSLCGSVLKYTDYGEGLHPSRSVTN